jgi:MerR family mercuric resistance operon transcriptional regulator
MDNLTTGQLAKQANVNLETIRYYERRGLLPEPPRNESGHRRYPIDALRRTEFIKRTQSLGFSLNEISDLLFLRIEAGTTCADVKTRVREKIIDVQEKIVDLKDIEQALILLADKCSGKGPVGQCPILEELYK